MAAVNPSSLLLCCDTNCPWARSRLSLSLLSPPASCFILQLRSVSAESAASELTLSVWASPGTNITGTQVLPQGEILQVLNIWLSQSMLMMFLFLQVNVWASLCSLTPEAVSTFPELNEHLVLYEHDLWHHKYSVNQFWSDIQHHTGVMWKHWRSPVQWSQTSCSTVKRLLKGVFPRRCLLRERGVSGLWTCSLSWDHFGCDLVLYK